MFALLIHLAQGVVTSYSWASSFPDSQSEPSGVRTALAPASAGQPVLAAVPVSAAVPVLAAVPILGLFHWAGHSAAKCPILPQYMQSPCAQRRQRSALESFPRAADKSIGLAAMLVAVVAVAVAVSVIGRCMWCGRCCGRRRLWVFNARRRQSSTLRRSTYATKLLPLRAGKIARALSISWFSPRLSA